MWRKEQVNNLIDDSMFDVASKSALKPDLEESHIDLAFSSDRVFDKPKE